MQNQNLTYSEKICWIRLIRSQGIGRTTFWKLIEHFGSATRAIEEASSFFSTKKQIKICDAQTAENEILETQKFGAEILFFFDEEYPQLLRKIDDAPPIITIKGKKELLNKNAIAIVGARNASLHGKDFAKEIASDLGKNFVVTVSGLARGIDTAAHKGSLQFGTIAVIAGGINNIYPRENEFLYKEISQKGLIISESPFNSHPIEGSFISRNRIISGLSLGTVIVEADLRSGSLTTARFALEQGREVFAVPGFPLDSRHAGTNKLIKDGAALLSSSEDIFNEFPFLKSDSKESRNIEAELSEDNLNFKEAEKNFEESKMNLEKTEENISKIQNEILEKISFTPIEIDRIIEESNMAPSLVNRVIAQLELLDKIEISYGKICLKK